MLYYFLLYSKVNQLYIYICPLFLKFPSHLGNHRALSRVPYVLISYLFYMCINSVYMSIPISQFIPFLPFSHGIHTFVLYVCLSLFLLYK